MSKPIVNDCPRHLAPPNPSSHSIICSDEGMEIDLKLQGVTSYFETRTLTQRELESCKWIHMTDEYNWDPHSEHFQDQEDMHKEFEESNHDHIDRNIYSINSTHENPNMNMM